MKKKQLRALAATLMISMCAVSVGCGEAKKETTAMQTETETTMNTEDERETIVKSAKVFMDAYKAYNVDALKSACSETVFNSMGVDTEKAESLKEDLILALGMEEDRSDVVEEAAGAFADSVIMGEIRDYEINDASLEGENGYVTVTIYHGPTKEAVGEIDLSEQYEEIAKNYADEHMDELIAVYNEKGEEEFQTVLKEQLFPLLLDAMQKEIDSIDSVKYNGTIELTKTDGNWVVTNFFENPEATSKTESASETSVNSESSQEMGGSETEAVSVSETETLEEN